MKLFSLSILVSISCFTVFGQAKVNHNGKFFNHNGVKIYYEETGKGEPLLLLHNFFGTADQWKPYVDVYSKQYRTIAVDMVGHGRSDIYKKGELSFKHEDYARIIFALLDSLKLNNVNAIGGSSGGITLLYLNTIQPERFKKVVAVGAQNYFSREAREWITKRGPDSANVSWLEVAAKDHGAEKAMLLSRQFWHMRIRSEGDPTFTPDILGRIKADWLVVQGDDEPIFPLQIALEMHKYIPNSRLWIVPNGKHLPHLDPVNQSEFLRVSLAFLNGDWNKK